jgi:hypothetical protein
MYYFRNAQVSRLNRIRNDERRRGEGINAEETRKERKATEGRKWFYDLMRMETDNVQEENTSKIGAHQKMGALCYKPDVREFDFWCHSVFQLT